jgi:hypothetical protein
VLDLMEAPTTVTTTTALKCFAVTHKNNNTYTTLNTPAQQFCCAGFFLPSN